MIKSDLIFMSEYHFKRKESGENEERILCKIYPVKISFIQ